MYNTRIMLKKIQKPNGFLMNIFTNIYNNDEWTLGSGPGSQLRNVKMYLHFLQKILIEYDIKSVIDLGCGDWTFSKHINWKGINYVGIDIVESIIDNNINEYKSENVNFYNTEIFDIQNTELYDLVIIKDVFQHLNYEEIFKILDHIKNVKFVLITNDFCNNNINCDNGKWRPLNFEISPFNLNCIDTLVFNSEPFDKISQLIKQTV
jgi:2-polyprenyl-3-methyl-5-hydroxy-6-metoxy-1,4-benzoquinol methylase